MPPRPAPERFPELDLIVKWGTDVAIAEGQCLWFMRKRLPQVPVPQIYGWRWYGQLILLYMELVLGNTLSKRWPSMAEVERNDLCGQLREMVTCWRAIVPRNDRGPWCTFRRILFR